MQKNYTHLSAEDRGLIMAERLRGSSGAHIARMLGRCRSTISRELNRNRVPDGGYRATAASAAYRRRQACVRRLRLVEGSALYGFVRHKLLDHYWFPQQIASRLRQMHPDDSTWQVSHETIYGTIYAHPKGALRQDMIKALRIHNRPEETESRQLPGRWEGDFMKGAFNRAAMGTLVERKSRFVVLCKMDECSAEAALEGFTRQMKRVPAFLRESLTYDRGSEMARHEELTRRLNLDN